MSELRIKNRSGRDLPSCAVVLKYSDFERVIFHDTLFFAILENLSKPSHLIFCRLSFSHH